MASKKIDINQDSIYEWICSIGYLLPATEIELFRFEMLHLTDSILVNEEAIDPFAILNGKWKRSELSICKVELPQEEQEILRMAARKHQGLPQDIMNQIKRNQQENNGTDNSKDQK